MVKKIIALAMVLGVLGGILAGCSKSDDSGTTPAAGSTATTSGTAPAATAGATAGTTTG